MNRISKLTGVAVLAASLAGLAAAPNAQAAATGDGQKNCFFSSQWRGWSSPSPDVLYLRVNNRDIYRVDLAGNNRRLRTADNFLVSKMRGSNTVCSALDLDLSVADTLGFKTPLFPRNLTKLTPEQVAAIPRGDLP